MKNFSTFLIKKKYIDKNSKILGVNIYSSNFFDKFIENGLNKFSLNVITDKENIYKDFINKKYYCIYKDIYDTINYNILDNEYNLIIVYDLIKKKYNNIFNIFYWILRNNKFLIILEDNIKYINFSKFKLIDRYYNYLIFKRYYIRDGFK